MHNMGIFILIILSFFGLILTLFGISELISQKNSLKLDPSHKRFHIVLIVLSILFPVFMTVQLSKSQALYSLISQGFWISFIIYDAFIVYLYLHLREERKGESIGDITANNIFKIIYIKILDLLNIKL